MDTTIYSLENGKESDIWFKFLIHSYETRFHNWQILLKHFSEIHFLSPLLSPVVTALYDQGHIKL